MPKKGKKTTKYPTEKIQVVYEATVQGDLPKVGGSKYPVALRMEAFAIFLRDVNNCSIEDVHKHEKFVHVPIGTFKRWAEQDKWLDHRNKAYAAIHQKLATETRKVLTEHIHREVEELIKWNDKTTILLEDPSLKPRSWEGVMKSKMEINNRLSELSQMVLSGVIDGMDHQMGGGNTPKALGPGLPVEMTKEKFKELAKIYTREQRDRIRARLRETHPEIYADEVEVKPEEITIELTPVEVPESVKEEKISDLSPVEEVIIPELKE